MPSEALERLLATRHVDVLCQGLLVGTLAVSTRGTMMFEYAPDWLSQGFALSPFSLPLREGLFETTPEMPDGLFGVFRDSLPDDWGRMLQDRRLAELGVRPGSLSSLARLSLVGDGGLGALEYAPDLKLGDSRNVSDDWDVLSRQCQDIIETGESEALDSIYARGSSSGGARPKVMVDIDGEPWIVKFPARADGPAAGLQEYQLMLAARACGIIAPEVRLIPSSVCDGFFAVKRFDRRVTPDGTISKVHMASAAALLEASPFDVLDYRDLMQLTLELTGDVSDCEQLFRVMCLNVVAGNCDDHMRNFSYLCSGDAWHLSPAYDLTIDSGFLGEHATLVNGKGADITDGDLVSVGAAGGVSARRCREIVRLVREVLAKMP